MLSNYWCHTVTKLNSWTMLTSFKYKSLKGNFTDYCSINCISQTNIPHFPPLRKCQHKTQYATSETLQIHRTFFWHHMPLQIYPRVVGQLWPGLFESLHQIVLSSGGAGWWEGGWGGEEKRKQENAGFYNFDKACTSLHKQTFLGNIKVIINTQNVNTSNLQQSEGYADH